MQQESEDRYRDVSQLFIDASEVMQEGDMLMATGFSLNEAMSAIEIGDSRMDSGALLTDQDLRRDFDPLTPMLPEEVCWILDRTFACEMEWHKGTTLSQTVHSCLYVHHLAEIKPNKANRPNSTNDFHDRPTELITTVIRAGVLGMVKCCDMAYRELNKGNVHDTEDWQGEKADIPLCEGIIPHLVIETLEHAENWLETDPSTSFMTDLQHRIRLRKFILKIFSLDITTKAISIGPLLLEARRHLEYVLTHPIPTPSASSPAHEAFDPFITRKLHSVMPLKPLLLPPQEDVWISLQGLLDGCEELSKAASCECLLAWEVVSNLRTCQPKWQCRRIPYLRSAMQSIFSNGTTLFNHLPYLWLVDRFFLEIVHAPLTLLNHVVQHQSDPLALRIYDDIQRDISKLLVQHIWALYHNRARNRRHMMKTALEWHVLYNASMILIGKLRPKGLADAQICECVPQAILHWRIGVIRDIILSGFELELYSAHERPFAYWYLFGILGAHERLLRELIEFVPRGTSAYRYLSFQADYASALAHMSAGSYFLTLQPPKYDIRRRWTNFMIRYKWAMRPEYDSIPTHDIFYPDYKAYLISEREGLACSTLENQQKAHLHFSRALVSLRRLPERIEGNECFALCAMDYAHHLVGGLTVTCEGLLSPTSPENANLVNSTRLKWADDICPWFPQHIVDSTSPGVDVVCLGTVAEP
ncbi:Mak10-domain-containing protein [Rickenella mellea]|uniref:Mak10-domain-containing protein n=1 Tax=Rickenella mellea TaxID=50990 RepID=A0A4Y7PTY9_9AGAM|nr:Mak10-domain-containing protein [Rickenella mellea]